ncbi:unnamed protein product [Clavelina lepadiformis]|uniref:Uncharacterized protein n=1 Tax=Clavelina lepadiformis TaxID=159417 RepID=A0ABP0G894_CLALP
MANYNTTKTKNDELHTTLQPKPHTDIAIDNCCHNQTSCLVYKCTTTGCLYILDPSYSKCDVIRLCTCILDPKHCYSVGKIFLSTSSHKLAVYRNSKLAIPRLTLIER